MTLHYPLFINGEFIDTKESYTILNPSTGEPFCTVASGGIEEAEKACNAAKRASDSGWKNISLKELKDYLLDISKGILDRISELAKLESQNTGKPIKETTFMDIPFSAGVFEYFANNLEKLHQEEIINIDSKIASAKAKLILEPHGVCLLIVPWNYPLLIASWKLAQALSAKNTVILKPSSLTPLSVLELAKIIADSGLPKGVVNIINGNSDIIGEFLSSDSRIDMISFTGSNSTGKKILEYSKKSIKKLIMELGGKSAGIVLEDADLELAVAGSLCSIFLNQGQMCTAISRIFVQDKIYKKFVDEFLEKTKKIRLGNSLDFQTQMGPLISKSHRERVIEFVNEAKKSEKLLYGGDIPNLDNLKDGFFFNPTIFLEVDPNAKIFREEVFGPVVCINKFSTIEEAIYLANSSDFSLAGCIWTKDIELAEGIAKRINAGIIWINTYGMFFNELPYGGFKQSGFGKELGRFGFLEYCRLKNIIIDNTYNKPLVNYWYGF